LHLILYAIENLKSLSQKLMIKFRLIKVLGTEDLELDDGNRIEKTKALDEKRTLDHKYIYLLKIIHF